MAQDLAGLPAVELMALYRAGELSPVAHVEACIAQIERVNPVINAMNATCFARARAEAKASEDRHRRGQACGVLDGLSLGVKDLQPTAGLLTTMGSPVWRQHVPKADLPMVAHLRAAGAIVLGKTNTPEHGAGGNSYNPVWGATGNPFDPNRLAGGSSGGSAAALAAGMMALATGSDTGGSLRLPAALCGVAGFRPSPGLVPHPTRPLGWSAISVLGPMARSLADLNLMLGVCVARDDADPLNRGVQWADPLAGEGVDLAKLRVGYSADVGGCPVEPAVRDLFMSRIARLAPQVAVCEAVDLGLGDMDACFDVLRAESFVAGFEAAYQERPESLSADIRRNVQLGLGFGLRDRAWAHAEQSRMLRRYAALSQDYDLILAPTSPVLPFDWDVAYPEAIAGQAMDIYYRWLALTYRPSLWGCPVLTLPCGSDAQGMPFGLQAMGRINEDAALLRAAQALEAFFESDAQLRRPRASVAGLQAARRDLRAIVTHPPDGESVHAASAAPLTAV